MQFSTPRHWDFWDFFIFLHLSSFFAPFSSSRSWTEPAPSIALFIFSSPFIYSFRPSPPPILTIAVSFSLSTVTSFIFFFFGKNLSTNWILQLLWVLWYPIVVIRNKKYNLRGKWILWLFCILVFSTFWSIDVTDCELESDRRGSNYPVKVDGLEVSPDPVKSGKPATFTVAASTGKHFGTSYDPILLIHCYTP